MIRKIFKVIIICLIIFGIIQGVRISFQRLFPNITLKKAEENIVNKIQKNNAELTEVYTYGRSLNIKGKIPKVSKDNIESVKLYLTDGLDFERTYNIEYTVDENNLLFETSDEINNGIILDKLEVGRQYYLLLRLKLNNSMNARYFSFENLTESKEIDYYTITKEEDKKLVKIEFIKKDVGNEKYNFFTILAEKEELPEDVYDIVIDAGHGGTDVGEKKDGHTEADIALDYAYSLKEKLENNGYKVKLTRDNDNTSKYTSTNMYDEDGRITVACESKAKLMISLHVNNGTGALKGFEIYCPPRSNLNLAKGMASMIKEKSSIEYSNGNSYKKSEGVYVRNFNKTEISDKEKAAQKNGYEPYSITENTAYLYTIREVGGFGTGAYVDGRDKNYGRNAYYDSCQGIECYQIELGYIKTDLDILLGEKEQITDGIAEAISEFYK